MGNERGKNRNKLFKLIIRTHLHVKIYQTVKVSRLMELCVDACCGHNLLRTHEICELVDLVAWYLHSLAQMQQSN